MKEKRSCSGYAEKAKGSGKAKMKRYGAGGEIF
jgi:hypothetical protein